MAEEPKNPLKSKTNIVNTLVGASVVMANFAGWLENATPEQITVGGVLWAFVNIVLRFVTKSEIAFPKKK